MDRTTHKQLMRLLHGELSGPEASALRRRLEREPTLQRAYRRLERQWKGLDLPVPEPAPPEFTARVLTRARELTDEAVAPFWWSRTAAGRAATAALLAGGIALGSLLAAAGRSDDWSDYVISEPTLAESYWAVVERSDVAYEEDTRP